jgi:hypothetical protein
MTAWDWGIAVGVASLILLLEETRKLIERFAQYCRVKFTPS